MIASDPIRTLQRSCKPGAVHIWVPGLVEFTLGRAKRGPGLAQARSLHSPGTRSTALARDTAYCTRAGTREACHSGRNRLWRPTRCLPGMRTVFAGSATAWPMTCALRPCLRRIASVGVDGGGIDHVAEADAHVEHLEHLAVVDAGEPLDQRQHRMRLDQVLDHEADRGGHAREVEQAVAGDVDQRLDARARSRSSPSPRARRCAVGRRSSSPSVPPSSSKRCRSRSGCPRRTPGAPATGRCCGRRCCARR